MADDVNSANRGFKTVALIISVLEEHERCVDRSVDSLAELTEQIVEGFDGLKGKLERVEQSVDAISADIKKLAEYLSKNPVS